MGNNILIQRMRAIIGNDFFQGMQGEGVFCLEAQGKGIRELIQELDLEAAKSGKIKKKIA